MMADVVFLLDVDDARLDAVDGRALVYMPKEKVIDAVQRHYPAAAFAIGRIGELADLDLSPLIKRPADQARATLEPP